MNLSGLARAGLLMLCALVGGSAFAGVAQAALPENRVYEMVSPPDKNGTRVFNTMTQSSADGESVAFGSPGAFGNIQNGRNVVAYVSSRGDAGWSTVGIQPPLESGGELFPETGRVLFLSADMSKEVVEVEEPTLVPGAPQGVPNLYVRDNTTGTYQLITTAAPNPVPSGYGFYLTFADASADLSHVVFQARGALTPEAPSNTLNLYEWHDGQLHQVYVPTLAEGGTVAGDGSGNSGNGGNHTRHSISDDGSRVIFKANAYAGEGGNGRSNGGQLYMKEGNVITHVSASQSSTPEASLENTHFMTATPDGGKILFLSPNKLTDNANSSETRVFTYGDLYLYDVASARLTDLTGGSPDPIGADVGEVLAASNDLSYIYFDAAGQLVPGKGASGASNIYLWHAGRISYIGENSGFSGSSGFSEPEGYDLHDNGDLTPDGRVFAFVSHAKLTSVENAGAGEIYVYNADTDQVACASCVAGAVGGVGLAGGDEPQSLGPTFHHEYSRAVSADGTVYFTSPDALVSADHNGKQDVYQWHEGVLSLISTGQSDRNSYLGDVSVSGSDVFFYTTQGLVSADWDGLQDLYDARLNGGFPPVALQSPCSGDTCRPGAVSPPALASPASALVSGSGNLPAASQPVVKPKVKPEVKRKAKKKKHRKSRRRRARAKHSGVGGKSLSLRTAKGGE